MTTTNEPQQDTLASYLGVVRRRFLLVLASVLVCGGAALGVSLLMEKEYEATASATVKDPSADVALLGVPSATAQTPLQVATSHAPQVTRPAVARAVQTRLRSNKPPRDLAREVEVEVDPNSYAVQVTATAPTGEGAARLANAFVEEDAAITSKEARKEYARAAARLERQQREELGDNKSEGAAAVYLTRLAQLQALSTVAAPVQVSTLARVPNSPSSPNLLLNTAAGLIFGLLLGIAIAYSREALDHRLRRSTDVHKYVDRPILGQLRSSVLKHTGDKKGKPAKGMAPLPDVDQEAFRFIRQNVRFLGNGDGDFKTLLVTSALAEEGKSTVAARLAMETAAAGKRTMLLECDMRRPVLAQRLGLAASPGLSDYLIGDAEPGDILQSVPAVHASANGDQPTAAGSDDEPMLVCITSGSQTPRPADLLGSERFSAFLNEVSSVYDCVILDSAPLLSVADTFELVQRVSGIIVCVRLEQTTRDQVRGADAALSRLPERPTGLVITDVDESDEGYYGYYGYYGARAD